MADNENYPTSDSATWAAIQVRRIAALEAENAKLAELLGYATEFRVGKYRIIQLNGEWLVSQEGTQLLYSSWPTAREAVAAVLQQKESK